ncbi:probable helicase with zinc finger domain [Watersipora subatra]|uniref:probable helicase with zinc finger domain n=1 Tax=Watersipora subatra TaxID=2589382 RepID=UPI00355B9C45
MADNTLNTWQFGSAWDGVDVRFYEGEPVYGGQQAREELSICNRQGACSRRPTCNRAHSEEELELRMLRMNVDRHLITPATSGNEPTRLTARLHHLLSLLQHPSHFLTKHMDGVEMYLDKQDTIVVESKSEVVSWIFNVSSSKCLTGIALMDNETAANFSLQYVTRNVSGSGDVERLPIRQGGQREWRFPYCDTRADAPQTFRVKVEFKCNAYGVYQQRVVFAMGLERYLYRKLKVTVRPMTMTNPVTDLAVTESRRWDSLPELRIVKWQESMDSEQDEQLSEQYKRPSNVEDCVEIVESQGSLSASNYRLYNHSLLYLEEMEQFHELSKLQLSGVVHFTQTYTRESLIDSTTNYARPAELFGELPLDNALSEDTVPGRILLQNVNSLLITCDTDPCPSVVFECPILDQGKAGVIFRVTAEMVKFSKIKAQTSRRCQVQFVVNRLPFCEMHSALDQLNNIVRFFPAPQYMQALQFQAPTDEIRSRTFTLNRKQKDGFNAMTKPVQPHPVLLIGPFGTGKTLTLAATLLHLIENIENRILVCTHSNSAADLYIKEHIHSYLATKPSCKVLRLYYKHRWSAAVHPTVKNYTLFDRVSQSFRDPVMSDLQDVRVVIVTLASCYSLLRLQLPKGFFTHIMVDEAAQAKEVDTIIPFTLAGPNTKIIMAGDHMQMNPDVFSKRAKKYGLASSMFERLTKLYPDTFECKVTLNENYRSHESLVRFSSRYFYNGMLEAKGNQPSHPCLYPLSFIAARGESLQHDKGTGYYNLAEVYETVDFVTDLLANWPEDLWGEFNPESVGIILPYTDQVAIVRKLLKEKPSPLREIQVEKISNVQGKQFRVVVINAVRTYRSCLNVDENEADFGFLSNPKLLNTAITRAQSLVTIIGDPFSLVTVGKCRSLWIHYLEQCQCNGSLHGVTFAQLQDYLNYMDIEKSYKFNPQAREFVPRPARAQVAASHRLVPPQFVASASVIPSVAVPVLTQGVTQPRWHPPVQVAPPSVQYVTSAPGYPSMPYQPTQTLYSTAANEYSSEQVYSRPQTPLLTPLPQSNYLAELSASWRAHTS